MEDPLRYSSNPQFLYETVRHQRKIPAASDELFNAANQAVLSGREFLFSLQREDAHWCAELESNPSITAEYVFLNQIFGRSIEDLKEKIIRYLLSQQNPDGSFGIAHGWHGDVSTTAEVYLALKILGFETYDTSMERAENYILTHGGLEKIRIFTRIFFALFGLFPWDAIPALPAEVILLPTQFPVNIYSLSSWARGTMIPLFVILHHRPIFSLPNGSIQDRDGLNHLWLEPNNKKVPYVESWIHLLKQEGPGWRSFFSFTDALLKTYESIKIPSLRRKSIDLCIQWILDRQEESGDWGGIFPPMINGLIALKLEGYDMNSNVISNGFKAIENFSWEDPTGFRIQACVSPVWDTALSSICLIDSGVSQDSTQLKGATHWLRKKQILVNYGDWKVYRPKVRPGGWSFEHFNSWYPDVDDTAAVVLALLKQNPKAAGEESVFRAIEWTLGMQNKDGGWAAFDVDNDKIFLNSIPFADIDALCDPSTPDVTGRVLEAFGMLLDTVKPGLIDVETLSWPHDLYNKIQKASQYGLEYLRKTQEPEGSWFGRWGVNYIYGTSNVLCGLSQLKISGMDPMIKPALTWLKQCQNKDGGWGEKLDSYLDKKSMGIGPSTPSQTAWALMGLLSYLPHQDPCIRYGIQWLIENQTPATPNECFEAGIQLPLARGMTWEETQATGTGFPKHFYLNYHFYRHYFPMMALGRFVRAHHNGWEERTFE
jgi:squalene-hopene/tetraprenyl-beta-curcumene cyclase